MKILIYLSLLFAVSLALAKAKVPDEEMKTWQFMTDSDEGHNDGEEGDEDAFGVEPTKHPYKQCLEDYHECVQNSCKIWERQKACLLQFYQCQNEYTGKCRKLYKSTACYNLLGHATCRKTLIQCYGSDSDKAD
ncbi:hypothetical protein ACROYT_G021053 [Oculina patagonica]